MSVVGKPRIFFEDWTRLGPQSAETEQLNDSLRDFVDLDEEEDEDEDEDEDEEDEESEEPGEASSTAAEESGASSSTLPSPTRGMVLEIEGVELQDSTVETFVAVLTQGRMESRLFNAIQINGCSLSPSQLRLLLDSLPVCPFLRILDLSNNPLGFNGALLLAQGLHAFPHLQELHIQGCEVGGAGALELLAVLERGYFSRRASEQAAEPFLISLKNNSLATCHVKIMSSIVESRKAHCGKVKLSEASPLLDPSAVKQLERALSAVHEAAASSRSLTLTPIGSLPTLAADGALTRTLSDGIVTRRRGVAIFPGSQGTPAPPEQHCENTESKRFAVGHYDIVGRRPDQQDATLVAGCFRGRDQEDLFCVFDGHGTAESSKFCAKEISGVLCANLAALESSPEQVLQGISSASPASSTSNPQSDLYLTALRLTFLELNDKMRPFAVYNGTTAVVALIADRTLYIANAGDSRAVLCQNRKAVRLSVDHKPSLKSEVERIAALGGVVTGGRVRGILAVSRSLGDHFCQPHLSPEPELVAVDLNGTEPLLLLACDGVFDVFDDQLSVSLLDHLIDDPQVAVKSLVDQAFLAGSTDNISAVVVNLHNRLITESSHPEPSSSSLT
ncbi:MAG: hypothetical protein Q8P67_04615 [archaeon]|nr:hypothetical protein [archaeon]